MLSRAIESALQVIPVECDMDIHEVELAIIAFLKTAADDYEADGRDSLAVHLRIVADELEGK